MEQCQMGASCTSSRGEGELIMEQYEVTSLMDLGLDALIQPPIK